MSSENYSGKTVSVAQNDNESERERGAVGGGAVRDVERMRAYDAVEYPSVEREVEYDLSVDGVSGKNIGRREAEQHCLDRGSAPEVNGSWVGEGESEFANKTLYTQERIEAREAELEKISTRAGGNPERYPRAAEKRAREERTMEVHQKRMEECREEVSAKAADGIVARGYVDDAREHVSKDVLGEVNEQAARLAGRFGQSRAVVGRQLGEKVAEKGQSVEEAVMDLVEELCESSSVVTPIGLVEPTDSEATIEGVVVKLYDPPASRNQQQAGVIEDETGVAKLTVWRNSRQDVVLSEGDVVRVQDGKPGRYNNQTTMAAVGDTEMWVVEEGDGPSPGNFGYGASGGQDQDKIGAVSPSMSSEAVIRPEHDRVNHRERWFFRDSEVPEWYEQRDDVERFESADDEVVAYMKTVRERFENRAVSWGAKQRREAEEVGRKERVRERKYNVPEWKRETSVITKYRHQDLRPFGADDQLVHLDLPRFSNIER